MAVMSDIAVTLNGVTKLMDVTVFAGDVNTENALVTAVLASLFSDSRAEDGDGLADGEDPRGWWGDTFAAIAGDRFGCRWWTRRREVVTDEVARWFAETGEEALQWLVEDGLAKSATVAAYRDSRRANALYLAATITRPDGSDLTIDVSNMWESLVNG